MRGHPSYKTLFSLQKGGLIGEGLLYYTMLALALLIRQVHFMHISFIGT
jgi:hypothetical protein